MAELLCNIFTDVMDLIFKNNGSVNKLIGDAILATFGCPVTREDDAKNAIKSALEIRDTLSMFNDVKPSYLLQPVEFGIGIASGKVFAGNIGSFRRLEYTVIGDVVNTASRLQALAGELGKDILIDGATLAKVPGLVTYPLTAQFLKGKHKHVDIHVLEGFSEELQNSVQEDGEVTFF